MLSYGAAVSGAGTNLGVLGGRDQQGNAFQASIEFLRDATSSGAGDLPSAIGFSTIKDGSSTIVRRMTIDNLGYVGIGVTNPDAILDLDNSAILTPLGDKSIALAMDGGDSYLETNSFDMSEGLLMQAGGNNSGIIKNIVSSGYMNGKSTNSLYIFNKASEPIRFETGNTERMIIEGAGDVGIGLSNPTSKLHVFQTSGLTTQRIESNGGAAKLILDGTVGNVNSTEYHKSGVYQGAIGFSNVAGQDYLFMYQGGNALIAKGGQVTIGANSDPAQTLDVEGSVQADGEYYYETAKERTYIVGPSDYQARSPSYELYNNGNNAYFSTGTTGIAAYAYAAIHVPNGAQVTRIEAWLYDNDATYSASVGLYRSGLGALGASLVTGSALTTPAGQSTSVQYLDSGVNSLNETINNGLNKYYVSFTGRGSTSNLRIVGLRITYTTNYAE